MKIKASSVLLQTDSFIVHSAAWGTSNSWCWLYIHSGSYNLFRSRLPFLQGEGILNMPDWYSTFTHLSCNRWQSLITSKRPQTKQAGSPSALVSSGVFGFLCRDYYLEGNRPTHLLPLKHKRGGKNLEIFRAGINTCSLHFDLYLWLILSNQTRGIETFVHTQNYSALLKNKVENILEKNDFALYKLLNDRRQFPSYLFYNFTFFGCYSGKKVTAEINGCVHWLELPRLINHGRKWESVLLFPQQMQLWKCEARTNTPKHLPRQTERV